MSRAPATHIHTLKALDGQNPLGLFAALGLLRVLDDLAREDGSRPPRLRFGGGATQVAEIETHLDHDALIEQVLADAKSERGKLALSLCYDERGQRRAADAEKAKQDLKPSPSYAAEYLRAAAEHANKDPRSAALAQAFLSEIVQDNNGNSKPTAFHFAAGQQQWLSMVIALGATLDRGHLEEALFGPWVEHEAPSLAWDSTVARNYALRATDPSGEKRGSIPGANWLAVMGLTFFPVNARGGRLETSRVVGGWKDSSFFWPLWSAWTSCPVARGLLRGDPRTLSREQRELLGVSRVLACRILRSDQGGYGSFTPADVIGARQRAASTRLG